MSKTRVLWEVVRMGQGGPIVACHDTEEAAKADCRDYNARSFEGCFQVCRVCVVDGVDGPRGFVAAGDGQGQAYQITEEQRAALRAAAAVPVHLVPGSWDLSVAFAPDDDEDEEDEDTEEPESQYDPGADWAIMERSGK